MHVCGKFMQVQTGARVGVHTCMCANVESDVHITHVYIYVYMKYKLYIEHV